MSWKGGDPYYHTQLNTGIPYPARGMVFGLGFGHFDRTSGNNRASGLLVGPSSFIPCLVN